MKGKTGQVEKDHLNWELIGECAKQKGSGSQALKVAHAKVENEEDEL